MTAQIITNGEFGMEVAGHLVTLLGSLGATARVVDDPDLTQIADVVATGGLTIRASWREVRAELDEFATAAATAAQPWLPVVLAHPHVRVGPAFVPDLGPCHTCYRMRVRQHAAAGSEKVRDELDRRQVLDRALGVAGYPPHVAALAAGLALGMVWPTAGGGWQVHAGRIAEINYLTDAVQMWPVVPVHGCPQCHPAFEQQAGAKLRTDQLRALARRRPDEER